MTWRHIGECLDSELMAGIIGEELGCNPALNTRLYEAVEFEKFSEAGIAPADACRRMTVAAKAGIPTPAAVIPLHIDDEMAGRTDCPVYVQGLRPALSPSLTPRGASAHETAPARRQARKWLRGELVVIVGGRTEAGGNASVRFAAQAMRMASRRGWVVLEGGGSHSAAALP